MNLDFNILDESNQFCDGLIRFNPALGMCMTRSLARSTLGVEGRVGAPKWD
jgi:hypothetical protein